MRFIGVRRCITNCKLLKNIIPLKLEYRVCIYQKVYICLPNIDRYIRVYIAILAVKISLLIITSFENGSHGPLTSEYILYMT